MLDFIDVNILLQQRNELQSALNQSQQWSAERARDIEHYSEAPKQEYLRNRIHALDKKIHDAEEVNRNTIREAVEFGIIFD